MGCFGRPRHTCVQQNVQQLARWFLTDCSNRLPQEFHILRGRSESGTNLQKHRNGRAKNAVGFCPIAISGFDDGEEHFDVDDP